MGKKIKRGLCVSGGGSWGSFGAGTVAALNREYDIAAGISTGALITPLALLGEHDRIKEGYTSITDKNVFDLAWYKPRPMKKNGKINMWAIIYALIMGNPSFGTTKAMKKLIDKFFKSTDYVEILKQKKEIMVGCQNLAEEPSLLHYFSTKYEKYDDFKDWMWFSANATFATSIVEKQWSDPLMPAKKYKGQWSDGGLTEVIPLDPILKAGCKEIDVIIHRPKPSFSKEIAPVKNLIEYVERGVKAMRYDIEFENLIETCEHMSKEHHMKITLYFLPRKLSNNSMVFTKQQMIDWWEEGFNTANDPERQIVFE